MKHIRFLKKARIESFNSIHQFPIGCVLESGGRIISTGYNQIRYKSRGINFTNYLESLHGERNCLSKVRKEDVSNATLYIWREGKTSVPRLAKPCNYCMKLIKEVGFVKQIVYTTNDFPYFEIMKIRKVI